MLRSSTPCTARPQLASAQSLLHGGTAGPAIWETGTNMAFDLAIASTAQVPRRHCSKNTLALNKKSARHQPTHFLRCRFCWIHRGSGQGCWFLCVWVDMTSRRLDRRSGRNLTFDAKNLLQPHVILQFSPTCARSPLARLPPPAERSPRRPATGDRMACWCIEVSRRW